MKDNLTQLIERSVQALNLKQYGEENQPFRLGEMKDVLCPYSRQYVLRCLVSKPFEVNRIPTELKWLAKLYTLCDMFNRNIVGIKQPFAYITVRHGLVESTTDDEWHVDGFSTTITHLPEQNYIWTNVHPTEYIRKPFYFPHSFDPQRHNIHNFFQDNINESTKIWTMEENNIYCIDPYIVHRRPQIPEGTVRTFVRISFTPIEIIDTNNTVNPLLQATPTVRDGRANFRNKLTRWTP